MKEVSFFIWVLVFFVTAASVRGVVKKQRCYVCIPNAGFSVQDVLMQFPSGPPIPLCNKFKPGRHDFIRDCPTKDNYTGCITERSGTHVTKSCSTIGVNDCQTANNISYCYCKGDLCNAGEVPEEEARPPVLVPNISETDDEDEQDWSASGDFSSELPNVIESKQVQEAVLISQPPPSPLPTPTPLPESHHPSPSTASQSSHPGLFISFMFLIKTIVRA